MVAAEETIRSQAVEEEDRVCRECHDTGMVSRWSEIAYFEDRRACARCETGSRVDSGIADIVRRAQLEERLSGRY
jgi:RNA polymerase subunit RPABC4/transcription elongation factor Spt4